MKSLYVVAALFSPLYLASVPVASAETTTVVVCYPGGPVSQEDAGPAMDAMLRVVERVGGWSENTYSSLFTASADECRSMLDSKNPAYAILSLGLFLEQRASHNLTPLVQPRIKGAITERYRIMTRQGAFAGLDDLKGKRVGGSVFDQPQFMQRIVFNNRMDPVQFFDIKPSHQVLRALRGLDKGELDAVILNGQQYSALDSLQLKTPLEVTFTSADIPFMGMTANSKLTTAEDRSRFTRALEGMCADPEGRKLCDVFGVEAFTAISPGSIEPMITLWNQGK